MSPSGSPSDYLAAERTFLAWIRTGLALTGLGFVVARFGLFLQTLQIAQQMSIQPRQYGLSFWFGTGLILLGVSVQVISAFTHVRFVRRLADGETAFHGPSKLAMFVALVLAVLGLALALYLISVRNPAPHGPV